MDLHSYEKCSFIASIGWGKRIHIYSDAPEFVVMEPRGKLLTRPLSNWRHDNDTTGHRMDLLAMAICRSTSLLATADYSGEIIVWNAVSGHLFKRMRFADASQESDHCYIAKLLFLESRKNIKTAASLVSCGPADYIHLWALYLKDSHVAHFRVVRQTQFYCHTSTSLDVRWWCFTKYNSM